jgi:hypothetical protein
MDSNFGYGDKNDLGDTTDHATKAAQFIDDGPLQDWLEARIPARDATTPPSLPGLTIERAGQLHNLEHNRVRDEKDLTGAAKAVQSIERGDFLALQKQLSDLAKGDKQNQTSDMPHLLMDIRKNTGIEVQFTNAEMMVTATTTDKESGRKDKVCLSIEADGKTTVSYYDKGGVEQHDLPPVEKAKTMIMGEATKGAAAKGIINEIDDLTRPRYSPRDLDFDVDFEPKEPGLMSRIGDEIALQRRADVFAKTLAKPEMTKDDIQYISMLVHIAHEDGRLKDFAEAVKERLKAIDAKLEFNMDDKHAYRRDVGTVNIELKREGNIIKTHSFNTNNSLKVWHPTYRPKK